MPEEITLLSILGPNHTEREVNVFLAQLPHADIDRYCFWFDGYKLDMTPPTSVLVAKWVSAQIRSEKPVDMYYRRRVGFMEAHLQSALECLRYNWVLRLDVDEWLVFHKRVSLRDVVAQAGVCGAYSVEMLRYTQEPDGRETSEPKRRLFFVDDSMHVPQHIDGEEVAYGSPGVLVVDGVSIYHDHTSGFCNRFDTLFRYLVIAAKALAEGKDREHHERFIEHVIGEIFAISTFDDVYDYANIPHVFNAFIARVFPSLFQNSVTGLSDQVRGILMQRIKAHAPEGFEG